MRRRLSRRIQCDSLQSGQVALGPTPPHLDAFRVFQEAELLIQTHHLRLGVQGDDADVLLR